MNDTDWSHQDDIGSMRGVAAGDELALRSLIDGFAPAVIAICKRILGSRIDAEGVAAELLAELWYRSEWWSQVMDEFTSLADCGRRARLLVHYATKCYEFASRFD